MSAFEGISMCSLLKSGEATGARRETNDRPGSVIKSVKEWLFYQRMTVVGVENGSGGCREKERQKQGEVRFFSELIGNEKSAKIR